MTKNACPQRQTNQTRKCACSSCQKNSFEPTSSKMKVLHQNDYTNRICCSKIFSSEFSDCFNLLMIYSYGTPKFHVCYNDSLKKPQNNCNIKTIVRSLGKLQKTLSSKVRSLVNFFCCKRIGKKADKTVSCFNFFVFCLPEFRFIPPNGQFPYGSKHCKHKAFASLKTVFALVDTFVGTIALSVNTKKFRNQQCLVYTT